MTEQHTFGGRGMDRYIADFEAIEAPVVDAAPAEAGGDPSPEATPAGDGSAGTPSPEAAPPTPTGLEDFDLEQLRELAEFAPVLRQMFTAPPAGSPGRAGRAAGIAGARPVRPGVGQGVPGLARRADPRPDRADGVAARRTRGRAGRAGADGDPEGRRHDTEQRLGEFLGDDQARQQAQAQMTARARELFPEAAARYGNTDRAANYALEKAHAETKAYQDAVANAAVERYKNQLTQIGGAPAEPGAGASGLVATPEGVRRRARLRTALRAPRLDPAFLPHHPEGPPIVRPFSHPPKTRPPAAQTGSRTKGRWSEWRTSPAASGPTSCTRCRGRSRSCSRPSTRSSPSCPASATTPASTSGTRRRWTPTAKSSRASVSACRSSSPRCRAAAPSRRRAPGTSRR
jgi:hypothetical protein